MPKENIINKFMKQIIFILFLLFFISCSEKEETAKLLVINFFEIYETKGINDAVDNIFQTNEHIIQQSPDKIESIKETWCSLVKEIGNYHGYEIISEYSLGKCLIHYCCVVKYEKQPVRFNFIFYKYSDKWVIYSFNFDNNIIDEV